ncbi:hypothetical protein M0805_007240 [Coniferiporia weirii]|nr:hypothetical protein M0805_007240 [Coniferiporia weirii]
MSDSDEGSLTSKFVLQTAGFDARFPNTNQSRHCFQNYTDYFKCITAKGEDFAPCKQFRRAYNSLCPSASVLIVHPTSSLLTSAQTFDTLDEWITKWDEQRENGNFPASLEP